MEKSSKAQIPAVGIMETGDHGDSKYYRIACSCGQPSDDIGLNVEVDDVGNIITHFWTTVQTCWWKERFNTFDSVDNPFLYTVKKWANDWINRVVAIWAILTKGYIELESWTYMTEQQTINFANTLVNAVDDVRQFRNERQQKKETPAILAPDDKPEDVGQVLSGDYKV